MAPPKSIRSKDGISLMPSSIAMESAIFKTKGCLQIGIKIIWVPRLQRSYARRPANNYSSAPQSP